MPRRGDPDRIYQAQRAGVFMRLVSAERLDQPDAEHWISRWEREAEANWPAVGSQGYWDAGVAVDHGEPPEGTKRRIDHAEANARRRG
jgi:hypothetical protein